MIHPSAKIHPTALVADGAVIGEDVVIGPFCIIEGSVEIKARTVLNSHIVVKGDTVIGEDNQIYQFASIGEVNQDLKYKGEATKTIIGNGNRIREHVTIHRGTIQGGGVTRIGNNNLLMINVHVAHDCQIKNISVNEPCFTGHFPSEPILPGVLILEALAQAMGLLAFKTHELKGGELFYFAGIDEARFKRPVLPGDQMELNVQVIKERRGITAFTGIATVNGEVACEAKLMCARR